MYYKEKDIILEFYGLRPYTTHFFYHNKVKITDRVKQFGKKLNQSLISDENGNLKVIYYLFSGIQSNSFQSIPSRIRALYVVKNEFVITNLNSSTLPDEYYTSSISFSSLVLVPDKIT